MINGAIIYEPLFPQPSSVLTLHRYYTKLMEYNTFKKRITTIAGLPEFISVEKKMLAIVEYCGTMPTKLKKHGNSKKSEPYIRTDPKVIQRAAEMAEHEKVSNVMTKHMEDNSFTAPKSTRQINDKRFRNRKRKREENMNSRINIADDVVSVLSELHSNPVIQEIILTKYKKPVVIVYSNQQMDDMIRTCEGDDGSVLGVDRTFNLGNFYVTVFSYKIRCLISNRTKDFPVMFGPCMIHFDAEEETNGKFFSHVSDRLGQKTRLTIGSDEEKSMTNAFKAKFPHANFLLCTKHIHENIRRHLQENGAGVQARKCILRVIFGKNDGIIFSADDTEFDYRCQNFEPYLQQLPVFKSYWQRFVLCKIKPYVFRPLRDGVISVPWTNNNSESMNHKLKAAVNWDRNKFPELIEVIGTIYKNQILFLRCALFSKGDWRIAPSMEHHVITQLVWHGMSQMEKDRHVHKFMMAKPPLTTATKSRYFSASNIAFKCPKASGNVGKKPCQRKRPASERTKTL
ncbi:hypothetical protein ACJMK2_003527 [Sinanodonta woodiana]|uniref:MULE transposase domain-containing protein n=1 Tax=Sinanodonta woodiana TaxID=1069815 RepID=A0ABD3XYH6_SINWO